MCSLFSLFLCWYLLFISCFFFSWKFHMLFSNFCECNTMIMILNAFFNVFLSFMYLSEFTIIYLAISLFVISTVFQLLLRFFFILLINLLVSSKMSFKCLFLSFFNSKKKNMMTIVENCLRICNGSKLSWKMVVHVFSKCRLRSKCVLTTNFWKYNIFNFRLREACPIPHRGILPHSVRCFQRLDVLSYSYSSPNRLGVQLSGRFLRIACWRCTLVSLRCRSCASTFSSAKYRLMPFGSMLLWIEVVSCSLAMEIQIIFCLVCIIITNIFELVLNPFIFNWFIKINKNCHSNNGALN